MKFRLFEDLEETNSFVVYFKKWQDDEYYDYDDQSLFTIIKAKNEDGAEKLFKSKFADYDYFITGVETIKKEDIDKKINSDYFLYWDFGEKLNESIDEMSDEYDSEGNQLTKAQVEFFKNSKVRDNKGRLLVCYHGGFRKFNTFDPKAQYSTDGFFFSDNKDVAWHFGGPNRYSENDKILNKVENTNDINSLMSILSKLLGFNVYIRDTNYDDNTHRYDLITDRNMNGKYIGNERLSNIKYYLHTTKGSRPNRYDWKEYSKYVKTIPADENSQKYGIKEFDVYEIDFIKLLKILIKDELEEKDYTEYGGGKGYIYYAYLNIKNPLIVDADKQSYYNIEFEGKVTNASTIASIARKRGYDGTIIKNVYETDYENVLCTDYIVYEPNQIKNIDNENPTNSDNINENIKKVKESVDKFSEVLYMPLGKSKVEIIKNPTRKMLRDLDKEQRELHPNIESYEPVIRFTYGENDNEYIWPAYDATHYDVERYIYKTFNEKTNQNKNFKLFDNYYDDLIEEGATQTSSEFIEKIKADLLSNGFDLESRNGGQCNEVTSFIEKTYGLKKAQCGIFQLDGEPISISHYINMLDGNTLVDFTASQYRHYTSREVPIPVIAHKDKDKYVSDIFIYAI